VIGRSIGPYQILAELGRGGMGEVYQARDTKLNRTVALKVLPSSFANDPDRLAKFKREAQILASLNHPNIAIIHGFEDSDDTHALVMELVPGRTLAKLINGARGLQTSGASPGSKDPGLQLNDALPIARQIASALEAAHEQGVIHRDLKPANVKVTDEGIVKVLDFGLAKALAPQGASAPGATDIPTITSPALTEVGVILGTAGYMSPEQAKVKPVDRRADIWALGVVLFEMLAGKPLYRGETVTETIAQVITQPPDWNALPETTPASVRKLLRRCLEKDPRNRYQSAGDVRIELEEILSGASSGDAGALVAAVPAAPSPAWRRLLPWAIAVALLAALVYTQWPRPAAPERQMRFEMRLGDEELFIDENLDGPIAVLSPDGGTIVYLGSTGPAQRLHSRPLDRLESQAIPGTEGARQHFFSPDGQSVAFFANGNLMKVPIVDGAATLIAPALDARGGTWGSDGTIVFSAATTTGLSRVPETGGTPSELTTLGSNERTHRWPWFLPGGKAVLFMCQLNNTSADQGTIEAVRLDTGERKVLVRGGTFPRYVESGHLLFSRENTVYAVAFDPDRLEVRGQPRPVLTGVFATGGGLGAGIGSTQVAFASNGTAVYVSGQPAVDSALKLAVVDRNGKTLYEYREVRAFRDPAFSRDGQRVFVRVGDGNSEHIHVLDLSRGTLTRIIFEGGFSGVPTIAPDNVHMAFASDRGGKAPSAYLMRNDGTGPVTPIGPDGPMRLPTSFSPDGRLLAVSELNPKSAMDLVVVSLADGKVQRFLDSPANEWMGAFSPDGRWMAYASGDSDPTTEVFVRAYPEGGALRQVSVGGGFLPKWTKRGRELVYGAPSPIGMAMMAVDVAVEGPALALGKPHQLFELPVALLASATSFDAATDGNRFAVILRSPAAQAVAPKRLHVTVVLNFFDDIRRAIEGR
jgi:hypothetical protein